MPTATSVEAMSHGDHACLMFSDPDERLDIVAAFVRDGLKNSCRVVCLTEAIAPDELSAELVERGVPAIESVSSDQLAILASEESWLADGEIAAAKMIDLLGRHLDAANRAGYAGLRVTADMSWVTRPIAAADQLPIFESEVARLFGGGRMTAICQYDREIFDAVTQAFAATAHPCTVAAAVYFEDPVLRICRQHSPPGIRLAGEIDYTHIADLTLALNEMLRLDRDPHVNLRKLRFIDAAAVTAIMHAALSLPEGRTMTVTAAGEVLRMVHLVGAAGIPALRVVRPHGEP